MKGCRLVRLTGPEVVADLAIAADISITELLPLLAEAVGIAAPRLTLYAADRQLAPGQTLAEAGVVDGDGLTIRPG